jgi:hypothetical protein
MPQKQPISPARRNQAFLAIACFLPVEWDMGCDKMLITYWENLA